MKIKAKNIPTELSKVIHNSVFEGKECFFINIDGTAKYVAVKTEQLWFLIMHHTKGIPYSCWAVTPRGNILVGNYPAISDMQPIFNENPTDFLPEDEVCITDSEKVLLHWLNGIGGFLKRPIPPQPYKGYTFTPYYDEEDGIWYGRIENIKDCIGFHSEDFIYKKFMSSVDDYIEFCKELGVVPDNPKK